MNRSEKKRVIQYYDNIFKKYKSVILIRNLGLTTTNFTNIKRKLNSINSKGFIVKNSLIKIVSVNCNFSELKNKLFGSIFIICSNNIFLLSKFTVSFYEERNPIEIISAVVNDKIINKDDIINISSLSSELDIKVKLTYILKFSLRKLVIIIKSVYLILLKLIIKFYKKELKW